jgi:general secretion pathway protein D
MSGTIPSRGAAGRVALSASRRLLQLVLCATISLPACAGAQQQAGGIAGDKAVQKSATAGASSRKRSQAEKMFLSGAKAFEKGHVYSARTDFVKATALDPANSRYSLAAEIARQYIVTRLVQDARAQSAWPLRDSRSASFTEAIRLDPHNPIVAQYLNSSVESSPPKITGYTQDMTAANAPIHLSPGNSRRNFHVRADERNLIPQVLNAFGIQTSIDQSVGNRIVSFDVADVSFSEAADLIQLATNTLLVPLDPVDALVVSDTKENRRKYQRQIMETISLAGLSPAEMSDWVSIARNILGPECAIAQDGQTISLRGPEPDVAAMREAFSELLAGQNEVQLDIHFYEIDSTNENDAGVVLPSSATLFNVKAEAETIVAENSSLVQEIISSGLASAGDYTAILAILIESGELSGTVFNNPFVLFGGGWTETGAEWSNTAANMLLSSSQTRSLNEIQLRTQDQEAATFRSGERYPVITSSYSAVSSSGSSSSAATVPQIQYQDLGLTVKVKPSVENEHEVGLSFDLKLTSLAGSAINDIPVLTNREYSGVISVRTGASALIASAVSRQDVLAITGVPGLSDIPGFEDATNREDSRDNLDLVVLITPHIVRLAHRDVAGPMLPLRSP